MSGRANQVDLIAAMTSVVDVAPHAAALRIHLRSIIESHAFKGSRRSQEFLQFVVDRALAGHFDDLKERILGVELFGRSPSYDTGDDAIVRVTACDVRKRLHQFYAEFGGAPEFRIELPPGSYIPEIHNVAPPLAERTAKPGDAIDIIETRVARSFRSEHFCVRRSGASSDRAHETRGLGRHCHCGGDRGRFRILVLEAASGVG